MQTGNRNVTIEDINQAMSAYRALAIGDYARVISFCTQAIQLKPDNADVCVLRGVAYAHSGDYDRAISDYTQAIRLKPNDAEVYVLCGLAYQKAGDSSHANEYFDKARELGYTEIHGRSD